MPETKTYDNIVAALAAFQSEIPVPTKDSSADTGKYSYDYASLDKLTPLILPLLASVGIAYVAAPTVREDGVFVLRAELRHTSGEIIGGDYPLGNPANPAQAIGSAITYARRYALLALTGVSPSGEDDDGAKAQQAQAENPATAAAPKQTVTQQLRQEVGDLISNSGGKLSGEDANAILTELSGSDDANKWTAAHLREGKTKLAALLKDRS